MKVQEILNAKILDQLENGVVPWVKPWSLSAYNAETKRKYSGANWLVLNGPYLTMKQVQKLKGTVKKGSKAEQVFYWQVIEKEKDGKVETIPFLKYYSVFKLEDCEVDIEQASFEPKHLSEFESILERHAIQTFTSHTAALYSDQRISMPQRQSFKTENSYYQTLAHELIHWTAKPLGRKTDVYAFEELVAEIGGAMLLSEFGITPVIDNTAAYCANWAKSIKADARILNRAATKAKQAVEYLTNE